MTFSRRSWVQALRTAVLLTVAAATACGGCGDDPPSSSDTGVADTGSDTGSDAGQDLGPSDMARSDMTPADVGGDAQPDLGVLCGNGVLDPDEVCDGDVFDSADSCIARGFTTGALACTSACEVSDAACDLCGDGTCGMSESATSFAAECAAVDVAAGYTHTCAVRVDGSVWCWGAREGHRAGGMGDALVPHPIRGITAATGVAMGDAHTCVIHGAGEVACWGQNGFGELGNGEVGRERSIPQPVTLAAPAIQLAAGRQHTCAVLDTGALACWGRGDHGEVGDGTFTQRNPVPVSLGLTQISFATAGEHHTCAANSTDGYCWGWNEQGQSGILNRDWSGTPLRVASNLRALGSGDRHTCAYIVNLAAPPQFSGLFCWGSNGYGQLGAEPSTDILGPQRIFAGYTEVEGGATFTCGLAGIEPASVECWGRNDFGQLGDGTRDLRYTPGAVLGFDNAMLITGGFDHACVLLDSGQLRCWGRNQHGQIGSAAADPYHPTPIAPEGFQ